MKQVTMLLFDCDRISSQRRIFPREVVEETLNKIDFKEDLKDGEIKCYDSMISEKGLEFNDPIAVLTDYYWEDNKCYGKFNVLKDVDIHNCNICGLVEAIDVNGISVVTDFILRGMTYSKGEKENAQ